MGTNKLITRSYEKIQLLLTEYAKGEPFLLRDVQLAFYGKDNFDADSREQYIVIYGCVDKGIKNALKDLKFRMSSDEGISDFVKLGGFHQEDGLNNIEKNSEYLRWEDRLLKEKMICPDDLHLLPVYRMWWEQQVLDLSEKGHNLLYTMQPAYKRGLWFLARDKAGWDNRQEQLLNREAKTFITKVQRSIHYGTMLSTGRSVKKMLGHAQSVKAMLEDGTSWQCSKCSSWNLLTNNFCGICGEPR